MSTIILGGYLVRYPLGGNLSWGLQYLLGLQALGHAVYFVEKFVHPDSCYDPVQQRMTDDASYGVRTVHALLEAHGLGRNWCFVDAAGTYHGLSQREIGDVFRRADCYIENGAHGAWTEEAADTRRVYLDVDPAFTQIKFYHKTQRGQSLPDFHVFYTNGWNVGRPGNVLPTTGLNWKHFFNPVHTDLFTAETPPPANAPYSTIMNWKSYDDPVEYNGVRYGHKNAEFARFAALPRLAHDVPLEMAVAGLHGTDEATVRAHGWHLRSAQEVTFTFESFQRYIAGCRGEFSVCKNMYVATDSGWFSDKSAAFMAAGRPVVVQETGFSAHLPSGEGLFAVRDVDEAKEAIDRIETDYTYHSRKAREIAVELLDARKILQRILHDVGI